MEQRPISELQTYFTDERQRCAQFKQLYIALKEKHVKLEDELALVYKQIRDARVEKEQLQSFNSSSIRKLEEKIREKQKEISQLTEKVETFDFQKIRNSIFEEVATHYEAQIKELHAEADKNRELYSSLHYNHAVLKCNFDSRQSEFSLAMDRLKLQHLDEVTHLQNKIEKLENEKVSPTDACAIELKSVKRDNLQLNAKLRGMLAECQELRAQNENLTLQLNSTQRTHLKQNADNISNLRMLESEKQKAVMRKEVLEKEISNFQEQKRIQSNDLQASRLEILSLKSKLEESEHKHQVIVTNLQVEKGHLKDEFEMEQQHLMAELSNVKAALKYTVEELNQFQAVSMFKEKELEQNLLATRQKIWKQSHEFDQEREKMERKFVEFQNQKEQLISELNQRIQVLQQNLRDCTESKLDLEKQFVNLRERLEQVSEDRDRDAANSQEASTQKVSYENKIRELNQQIDTLRATIGMLAQEKDKLLCDLSSRKQQIGTGFDEQNEILQLKLNWEQQKHQYRQRLDDLESQLKDCKNASEAEKKDLERKIQQFARKINNLKEKAASSKTHIEELENKNKILEKNIPPEAYFKVTNKLTELQRRLEEYRLIVSAEPHFCRSTARVPDKLLTDIKNLQLRIPSINEHEPPVWSKEPLRRRSSSRRSLKTRNRDQASRISPAITSSSDLELENL